VLEYGGELFDVEIDVVELWATDGEAVVFEQSIVEIAHRKGYAVRDEKEVGVGKAGRRRGEQFQLDGPVGKLRWVRGHGGAGRLAFAAEDFSHQAGADDGGLGLMLLLLGEMCLCGGFVEIVGLSLLDCYSVFGAVADTGAEAVTVGVTNELCLAIDYFYCALGAGLCA